MTKTSKRIATLLLTLCLLLGLAVPAVSAVKASDLETVAYNLDGDTIFAAIAKNTTSKVTPVPTTGSTYFGFKANKDLPAAISVANKEGNINWKIGVHNGILIDNDATYLRTDAFNGIRFCMKNDAEGNPVNTRVGRWLTLAIDAPAAGTYDISIKHAIRKEGIDDIGFYIIAYTGALSDTDVQSKLDDYIAGKEVSGITKVGSYSCTGTSSTEETKNSKLDASYTFNGKDKYLIALRADASDLTSDKYIYLSNITLTPSAVQEEIPGDEGSEGGEEEAPGLVVEPVDGEIALSEAVRTATASKAGMSVVNGHDYIYIFLGGNKLLVYDLDTKQKVDEELNAFGTTRAIVADKNGIIWACGAANYLYRYDPFTGEGIQVPIPGGMFTYDSSFNAIGLTLGDDGKLYFGTYNRGHLGVYDPVTETFENLSGWLDVNLDDDIGPDAQYAGYGGLVVKDGYIYAGIDGDKNGDKITTHALIKFSIAERKIVQHIDLTKYWGAGGVYFGFMNLVGDIILCGSDSWLSKTIAVDISGEKMKEVELEGDMDVGFSGFVSGEIDGKRYCFGNTKKEDGLFEIDLATMKITELDKEEYFPANASKLIIWGSSLVTIEGDDRLPGTSLVTYKNNNGNVDMIFYNIQTKETVTWEAFTFGEGSGNQLNALAADPEGKIVYAGAYGTNPVARYDVSSAQKIDQIKTYDHQTDGLAWYNGKMYVGNYQSCTITELDPATGKTQSFFAIKAPFDQYRMHALVGGGNKIFAGTVPASNVWGGVLAWWDFDKQMTYVAFGPNPEDVYYAKTQGITPAEYEWHRATDDAVVDLDYNKDGTVDANDCTITLEDGSKVQRYTGLIKNQCINAMVYKDGYIYGSTTTAGGSGTNVSTLKDPASASLFVYDVAAMKVVATLEISDAIDGLPTPTLAVDGITEDPDAPGKFWGVVYDTLFSFTFDIKTNTFAVKEELSFGKTNYNIRGSAWHKRDMLHVGDYLVASFGTKGTYLINKSNVAENAMLSTVKPLDMVLGCDADIYYADGSVNIKKLDVSSVLQPILDKRAAEEAAQAAAAEVDKLIGKIGKVTQNSGPAIVTARAAYNALDELGKSYVTKLDVLVAAEAAYADAVKDPTNPGTGDNMPVMVLVCVALVSLMAVAVVPAIRKKVNF